MNIAKEKLRQIYGTLRSIGKENNTIPHGDLIVAFAKMLKPKTYVELGVYKCEIVNKMIPWVQDTVYAVDIQKDAGLFMKKSSKAHFYNGTTDNFAAELKRKNHLFLSLSDWTTVIFEFKSGSLIYKKTENGGI